MKKNFLLWDLDDTLIPNQMHYELSKLAFARYMVSLYGIKAPNTDIILAKGVEIDSRRYKEMQSNEDKGLAKDRFPDSMVITFKELCKEYRLEYDKYIIDKVKGIGHYAFDEDMWRYLGMLQGAEEVLEFCRDEGCIQYLLTKGDPRVQDRKVEAFGLEEYFGDNIKTVWAKTPETFASVFGTHPRNWCYAIGDSTSDFKPYPEVTGIHIPKMSWEGQRQIDKGNEGIEQKVIVLDSIMDIKKRYGEIFD
ncbi:MAG: HAD family hydrolase [Candidatus Woesearchaeota archaeon]